MCEVGPSKAGMRLVSISSEAHLKIRKACEEVAALQNIRWPSEGSAQKGPHLSVRSIFFKIKMNHSWLLGAAPGWGWGKFQHSSASTTSSSAEEVKEAKGKGQARPERCLALLTHLSQLPGSEQVDCGCSRAYTGLHPSWGAQAWHCLFIPTGKTAGPTPQPLPPPSEPALGMWCQGQGQTSHSALSFTNVMKASGVHAWEDTLPVLLGSKPQTGEVLVSQPWATESPPRCSLGYGDSQAET